LRGMARVLGWTCWP